MDNFFDKIVYFNLDESTDKNEYMKDTLLKHNIKADRRKAVKGVKGSKLIAGYEGLNKTWVETLNEAIENDLDSILIFEDDVVFTPDAIEVFAEAVKRDKVKITFEDDLKKPIYESDVDIFGEAKEKSKDKKIIGYEQKRIETLIADLPDDWDCLSLGCINSVETAHISGRIHKVRVALLAHAVAVRKTMFAELRDLAMQMEHPIDICIAKVLDDLDKYKWYCFKQGIALQREGYSDCLGEIVEAKEVD